MEQECPKLRPLEFVPITLNDGRRMLLIRDPLHLCSGDLCLPLEAAPVLGLFDGKRSLPDIKAEIVRLSGGLIVPLEDLERLVQTLDGNLLLDNPTFRRAWDAMVAEFRESLIRPAFHCGAGYPDDPGELAHLLDGFYDSSLKSGSSGLPKGPAPVALVAPHIDVRSGGPAFAKAYQALANTDPLPDLFVILGTGHQGLANLFSCTRKTFTTPFGSVETDGAFVDALNDGVPVDLLEEEQAHRTEHVIEFQVIFLQHLFGGNHDFKIVPVLCSFDPHFLVAQELEVYADLIERFTNRLRELVGARNGRICMVASVDLDHIGPRYGDDFQPDEKLVEDSLEEDRVLLKMVSDGNRAAFLHGVHRDNHRKRICGFSPIYTLMGALPEARGELLTLDHSIVDGRGSFVSYAAMAFHRP